MGLLKEDLTFDSIYQQSESPKYKYLTGENVMEAVMYEFYSNDGMECIKIEFLLGSDHNCIIDVILSECHVDSIKRVTYYTSLEEKFGEFGSPKGENIIGLSVKTPV